MQLGQTATTPLGTRPGRVFRRDAHVANAVWVAALAAVAVTALVLLKLAMNDWQAGAFPHFGADYVDPSALPRDAVVHPGGGYDGQFVHRLALDPLTGDVTDYGVRLDWPAYRSTRVALPAIAWALSYLGIPVFVGLILVNALALVGVAYFASRLVQTHAGPALIGLVVALAPGLLISLSRDLTEPLAICGLLAGMWWWQRKRYLAAGTALCVGVLARETILAVLAGIGAYLLYRAITDRHRRREHLTGVAVVVAPLVAALAWQVWLWVQWGVIGLTNNGTGIASEPIVGVFAHLLDGAGEPWLTTNHDVLLAHLWVIERFALLALIVVAAIALASSRIRPEFKAGWVTAVVLAFLIAWWSTDVAFLRATIGAFVLSLLVVAGSRPRLMRPVMACCAVWSGVVFVVYGALL